MEWVRRLDHKYYFFKMDFAKAYDRIEWPFILAMLKSLGFGPNFIQVVQMLFLDASTCIYINGR